MFVFLQGFCKAALREYQRENPPSEAEEEEEADDEEEDDEDSFPLGMFSFLVASVSLSH